MMKRFLLGLFAIVALALPEASLAQTVTKQPFFVQPGAWVDLGNGPTEVLPIEGNGSVYASLGTATSTAVSASTTMTLSATPAIAPCVGCLISGTGITSGTTVAAYNGTTGITLSAAMTVANGTAVSYGAACPTSGQPTAASLSPPLSLRVTTRSDLAYPIYSQARVCLYGGAQAGFTAMTFPIGAW
jgi:hypothetical protein